MNGRVKRVSCESCAVSRHVTNVDQCARPVNSLRAFQERSSTGVRLRLGTRIRVMFEVPMSTLGEEDTVLDVSLWPSCANRKQDHPVMSGKYFTSSTYSQRLVGADAGPRTARRSRGLVLCMLRVSTSQPLAAAFGSASLV